MAVDASSHIEYIPLPERVPVNAGALFSFGGVEMISEPNSQVISLPTSPLPPHLKRPNVVVLAQHISTFSLLPPGFCPDDFG